MVATTRSAVPATAGQRRSGDRVRVRSREDILATLDEHGRVDGLPFMPEMLRFAGREMVVHKSAHKACDTINKRGTTRRLDGTLHLAGARCDGSAHGGCQAGCLLFWREEWLEDADGTPLRASRVRPSAAAATEQVLAADTRAGEDAEGRPLYRCSATELVRASDRLSAWDLRQYVEDVRTGNTGVRQVVKSMAITLLNKYQALSRRLPERLRIAGGRFYPFYAGTGPGPKQPPLDLRPGELVVVRSRDEIMATLGPDNRNRGLWFDGEMLPYCGRRGRVLARIERIIDETSGRMLRLRDCIVLDGMTCEGRYNRFCPRSDHIYWREAWLRRVADTERGPAPGRPGPGQSLNRFWARSRPSRTRISTASAARSIE